MLPRSATWPAVGGILWTCVCSRFLFFGCDGLFLLFCRSAACDSFSSFDHNLFQKILTHCFYESCKFHSWYQVYCFWKCFGEESAWSCRGQLSWCFKLIYFFYCNVLKSLDHRPWLCVNHEVYQYNCKLCPLQNLFSEGSCPYGKRMVLYI